MVTFTCLLNKTMVLLIYRDRAAKMPSSLLESLKARKKKGCKLSMLRKDVWIKSRLKNPKIREIANWNAQQSLRDSKDKTILLLIYRDRAAKMPSSLLESLKTTISCLICKKNQAVFFLRSKKVNTLSTLLKHPRAKTLFLPRSGDQVKTL